MSVFTSWKIMRIILIIQGVGIMLGSMVATAWQSTVGMISCKFCWGAVKTWFSNIAAFFVNPQRFIYESVMTLKEGIEPKYTGYYLQLILISSIVTVILIWLITSLFIKMASPASTNFLTAISLFFVALFVIYIIQLLYTHFVLDSINWMPFYGWIELIKERALISSLSSSTIPGAEQLLNNTLIPPPSNVVYV